MNHLSTTSKNGRNYWNPLEALTRDVTLLFGPVLEDAGSPVSTTGSWQPFCDIAEADDHYMLNLEIPGVPKDKIKIEAVKNKLIVSGERKLQAFHGELAQSYSERKYGSFERAFTLAPGLDSERIEADIQDGVLSIMIPKSEKAKPRQIKIGSGQTQSFFSRFTGLVKDKPVEVSSEKPNSIVAS